MKQVISFTLAVLLGLAQAFDRQALASWFVGLNPDKVVLAINCGASDDLVDQTGFTYQADAYYQGGQASETGEQIQWALPNSEAYHAERWGNFKYQLPMPTNSDGQYTLILKFSEIYFGEPGQKVFDIKIGNTPIIRDLDIFERVSSRGIPYDEFIDIKVQGGKVYANGAEAKEGIKNGKLVLDFVQGKSDNPKVNAIVLVEGGKENTHFQSHKTYLKVLHELREQQMR